MAFKIDRKLIAVSAVAGLLVAGGLAVTLWPWSPSVTPKLLADDINVVSRGSVIYAKHCASCHGKKLKGQPNWRSRLPSGRLPAPPHDATGHTWHHSDAILFRMTKLGPATFVGGGYESDMPAYAGTLLDDEIIAVLSYIKSTWPSSMRQRHDTLNQTQR